MKRSATERFQVESDSPLVFGTSKLVSQEATVDNVRALINAAAARGFLKPVHADAALALLEQPGISLASVLNAVGRWVEMTPSEGG